MIRRNPLGENPAEKYGKLYDDTIITYYHLQFGRVVFVDRADYVWVQYGGSISNSDRGADRQLLFALLPIQHAMLIPKFRTLFITQYNRELAALLRQTLLHRIPLTDSTECYYAQFDAFIFQYFAKGQRGILSRLRIARALLQYYKIHHRSDHSQATADKLYSLLVH